MRQLERSEESDWWNDVVTGAVKGVLEEPVEEIVRKAIREELGESSNRETDYRAPKSFGPSVWQVGRLVVLIGMLTAITYVIRRWRTTPQDEVSVTKRPMAGGDEGQPDHPVDETGTSTDTGETFSASDPDESSDEVEAEGPE